MKVKSKHKIVFAYKLVCNLHGKNGLQNLKKQGWLETIVENDQLYLNKLIKKRIV
jgi:hypothetical protein